MEKRVRIEIPLDGTVTIKTEGFKGKSCKEFTKPLEDLLGEKLQEKNTPEFYEGESANANLNSLKR